MKNFNTKKLMTARKTACAYVNLAKKDERYADMYREAMDIYLEQLTALNSLINEAQRGARVRKIEPIMVVNALEEITGRLFFVKKKNLAGVMVTVDCNAQDFPGAYKGVPESTLFNAVYKGGAWVITDIYRSRTRPSNSRYRVYLNDAAAEDILNAYRQW